MRSITYEEYNSNYGTLIDVEESETYKKKHYYEAINIPFEKLLGNYKKLLNKDRRYYITCRKGIKSKKVCSILEYYGYDVTQIIN